MIYRDHVDVKYTISLTRLLLIEEIIVMNKDGDAKISEEEKKAYYSALREKLRKGLNLALDGRSITLDISQGIELRLPVYRVFHFRGRYEPLALGAHEIQFSDKNYPKLPGPVEIVAKTDEGIALLSKANVDLSKSYQAPGSADGRRGAFQLRELQIRFRVGEVDSLVEYAGPETKKTGGASTESAVAPGAAQSTGRIDRLAKRLFQGEVVGVGGTVVVLCTFILLGAAHALTPGHGKTIVAAYLIGSKGRVRDAVFLGVVVTFTHTASVVALGVVVQALKNVFLPARLNPFIASASGVLIFVMGICLLVSRARGKKTHNHDHDHEHTHDHMHDHDHDHSYHHEGHEAHDHGAKVTTAALLSLGIAGGIVPCPDALAVLLLAISFNHLLLGLLLLLAFSLGLAVVLIAIGVLLVTGRLRLSKGVEESRVVKYYLPVASAVAIAILGAAMAIVPLVKSGILTIHIRMPA